MKFEDLKDSYVPLWKSAKFRPGWKLKADKAAIGIVKSKPQYQAVENATGVPWFVVGLIHQMESDCDFKTHLHNGDSLDTRTVNEPVGRPLSGNPPFNWSESAVDALNMQKLQSLAAWPLARIAFELERYNGFRSRTEHQINTPYLWSGTNHYSKGKFIKDNVWSDTAVSKQVGAMAVLLSLTRVDDAIAATLDAPSPPKPDIPAPDRGPGAPPPVAGRDFDLRELQLRLSTIPFYPPADVDGDYGPRTQVAIQAFLVHQGVADAQRWRGEALVIAGAQALCRMDGIDAGPIDGVAGPQTRYALEVYAGRKRGDRTPETWRDELPPPHDEVPATAQVWPRQDAAAMNAFYGPIGSGHAKVKVPDGYPMVLYDGPTPYKALTVHSKIVEPVGRVLKRTLAHYGPNEIVRLGFNRFFGCYNDRAMRGGTKPSTHSWAAALDFNANKNDLHWNHTRASFAHPDCKKWFEFWAEEGAIALGPVRDFDWMHIQFARL